MCFIKALAAAGCCLHQFRQFRSCGISTVCRLCHAADSGEQERLAMGAESHIIVLLMLSNFSPQRSFCETHKESGATSAFAPLALGNSLHLRNDILAVIFVDTDFVYRIGD